MKKGKAVSEMKVHQGSFGLENKSSGQLGGHPTDSRPSFSLEKKSIGTGSRPVNQPEGFAFGPGTI